MLVLAVSVCTSLHGTQSDIYMSVAITPLYKTWLYSSFTQVFWYSPVQCACASFPLCVCVCVCVWEGGIGGEGFKTHGV